jgi:exocyst complex component 2
MSDSDVDEDELLQMALQEQAARDLSHQRPAGANKPVVNLVRPPAPSSSRGANARGRAREPSRGGDEDEDSEVELLSISSGDEDAAPARERGPPPPRGGGGGRAGARRAASRDDGDLDDAEPRSWKRVDEAEVRIPRDLDLSGLPSVEIVHALIIRSTVLLSRVSKASCQQLHLLGVNRVGSWSDC